MPILKKNDVTPERPVIILLYGVAGTGKTSLATTSENPILIDCDKGYDRASTRVDTLLASKWDDITCEMETIKQYKTVILDTCRSALDDFISVFVVAKDYKLQKNQLKKYGAMGEEFKDFVAKLRANNSDLVFICHDKETTEGDIIKHAPDCTGQSKDLLVRIADQVGYLYMENGKRTINFQPTDTTIGKDTAQLGKITIPSCNDIEFNTKMAEIIAMTKRSIQGKGEAQREALKKLEDAEKALNVVETEEDANKMIEISNSLAKVHQAPFKNRIMSVLKEKGFELNKETKKFVKVA